MGYTEAEIHESLRVARRGNRFRLELEDDTEIVGVYRGAESEIAFQTLSGEPVKASRIEAVVLDISSGGPE